MECPQATSLEEAAADGFGAKRSQTSGPYRAELLLVVVRHGDSAAFVKTFDLEMGVEKP